MGDTSRNYLVIGALYLCIGLALGIFMGIRQDFTLAPVHAHINLVGFACHTLFGIAGRAFPALATDKLAKLQFAIFAAGSPLLMVGIALSLLLHIEVVVVIGSLLVFVGALLFALMTVRAGGAGRISNAQTATR